MVIFHFMSFSSNFSIPSLRNEQKGKGKMGGGLSSLKDQKLETALLSLLSTLFENHPNCLYSEYCKMRPFKMICKHCGVIKK